MLEKRQIRVMFIERHDEAPTHYKVDLTGLE